MVMMVTETNSLAEFLQIVMIGTAVNFGDTK